jgi:LmbE family N-acetylglucosaminyl deacetylase
MARPLVAGLVLLAVGLMQCGPRRPPGLVLPAQPRVLVFSPHPDDETIALGGLLFELAHAGAPVRVVFLTNGDGYLEATQERFHVPEPRPADYRALGWVREKEARAADERLGLRPEALRFLGFPDDGLAALWGPYWSQPYTSPRTGARRPPYANSVAPEAAFEGRELTALLERQLTEFAPTVVLIPHPADTHADHVHTSYFVIEALRSLEARGALPADVLVLTYLVHYPSWPHRAPSAREWQLPIDAPPDTVWLSRELTPAALAAKREAVAEYDTQLAVMRGFLQSFVARNELFGRLDTRVLDRIASVH